MNDAKDTEFVTLLKQRLPVYQPIAQPADNCLRAAVSVVFRSIDDVTELLLIQRAFHKKDPWSGQIAFPGGRLELTDDGVQGAAVRETHEEVGLSLPEAAYIGQLDDKLGPTIQSRKTVHVSSFVYHLVGTVETTPNYEVKEIFWVPLERLRDDNNVELFEHSTVAGRMMRAIRLHPSQPQMLWGLSLWILFSLFAALNIDPDRDYRIVAS